MTIEDDEWTPREDAWTILVQVSADKAMPDYREFNEWMSGLCEVIGATRNVRDWEQTEPWVVGLGPHGQWRFDHFGMKYLDTKPYANVWQSIEGVASKAMSLVWAAIHLVEPLETAGYNIGNVSAELTDEMVLLA